MFMRSRVPFLISMVFLAHAACDDDDDTVFLDAAAGGSSLTGGSGGTTSTGGTTGSGGTTGTGGTSGTGGTAGAVDGGAGADAAATAPTFTMVYNTVIAAKCMPCHTTAGGIGVVNGKLDMTSKMAAFTNLVGVAASGVECMGGGRIRVVAGDAEKSVLYLKVSLDDPTPCGAKMPLGLPALSEAEADMIEHWIDDGAKNN
jgi:hypothetical protein